MRSGGLPGRGTSPSKDSAHSKNGGVLARSGATFTRPQAGGCPGVSKHPPWLAVLGMPGTQGPSFSTGLVPEAAPVLGTGTPGLGRGPTSWEWTVQGHVPTQRRGMRSMRLAPRQKMEQAGKPPGPQCEVTMSSVLPSAPSPTCLPRSAHGKSQGRRVNTKPASAKPASPFAHLTLVTTPRGTGHSFIDGETEAQQFLSRLSPSPHSKRAAAEPSGHGCVSPIRLRLDRGPLTPSHAPPGPQAWCNLLPVSSD